MLDIDLSDPVNQVRAIIGDLEREYISDSNISFLLTKNNDDVTKASLEAFEYVLNQVAYYIREEAGDVVVYWSNLYNQLSDRYANVKKAARYTTGVQLFKFGGTTASEVVRIKNDPESVGIGISKEDFSSVLESYSIDPDNPYLFVET